MSSKSAIVSETLASINGNLFDELVLTSTETRQFAIRIAHGIVCRENALIDKHECQIFGSCGGRHGSKIVDVFSKEQFRTDINGFHAELLQQKPDEEYIPLTPPKGKFQWILKESSFRPHLSPAAIYPIIEKHVKKVRDLSLRVTGYIEINEKREHEFHKSGFELETFDYGFSISFTVDRDQQSTGVGRRYSLSATLTELDELVAEALGEATAGCETNSNPSSLAPGDYTVVLSPSCVANLLFSCLYYGYFDRRKIDEMRTFLSGKWQDLIFPEGLMLSQLSSVMDPQNGLYCLPPFNNRRSFCEPLSLVQHGRIQDLHTGIFWARKNHLKETFSPSEGIVHLDAAPHSPLTARFATEADIIKNTARGIYIADLWYLRIVTEMDGIMTGMTRDGVYEIIDGKITRPLRNLRWHDNPIRILQSITALSQHKKVIGLSPLTANNWSSLAYLPSVRVEKFHFSSETRF
jgi:predicted Zn-dependent protease